MIPDPYLAEWRSAVPWTETSRVELDLVGRRALVEIFGDEAVARSLALRGGTALYRLYLTPAPRFTAGIDLVQRAAEPIGPTLDRVRGRLDPWLGRPKRLHSARRWALLYRFDSADGKRLRLKLDVDTGEHFSVLGVEGRPLEVRSRWFSGSAEVSTFALDELLGTKLRALHRRRIGRDLFDLWWVVERSTVDLARVARCFAGYLEAEGRRVTRAELEASLGERLGHPRIRADVKPLLAPGVEWDPARATRLLFDQLTPHLPGGPWKGLAR